MPDSLPTPEKSNALDVTVSELSGKLKRTVEETFGHVRVRGEISGYRGPHSSGHSYFSLKDDRARLEAVIWKGVASKLKHLPEEGLEVVASGKLTTYPGSSKYQIVIDNIEPAGAGALMALLEERRRKLAAEGLFADEAKQPLPFMPNVIGVVTSPTGAVIRDVLHRIADRFPVHVIVWPVRVQGDTSGREVANGIYQLNKLPLDGPIPRPDVIIVARGGGSLEDLWGFNDEVVVRSVAASKIPLISAVGHETDWTLIDHAADHRAPTPTAAAERAVPVKADLEAYLADLGARLRGAASRNLQQQRDKTRAAARALPSLDTLLAVPRRDFDEAAGRLVRGLSARVVRASDQLKATARRNDVRLVAQVAARKRDALARQALRHGRALQEPVALKRRALDRALPKLEAQGRRAVEQRRNVFGLTAQKLRLAPLQTAVSNARRTIDRQAQALDRTFVQLAERNRGRLDRSERLLSTLGYRNVLARGYAVIRDGDKNVVRDLASLDAGARVELLAHGAERMAVLEGGRAKARAKPKPKTDAPATAQGDLF